MHGPVLKIFNTFTKEKQEVSPQNRKELTMYTCGPTVYDFAHIGNLRAYLFEDFLRRTIEYFGFSVKQVMNITDMDDKTIEWAIKKNLSLKEYTQPYIDAFFEDLKTLNIQRAQFYPKATDYIPRMIEIIQKLMEKGFAYQGKDQSIYFSIEQFSNYGKLSHLKLDDLKPNAANRLSVDEYEKENASDFVLWKAFDEKRDGHIYWDSPFGKGRPGWHIECSAMAIDLLGKTIDIHCGGVDNIFPHHENEIAQSESYTGQTFVHLWVHCEHLLVDGKKMSKSLGNFYTLRDLLSKGYTAHEIRYILLQTHYRNQLNFTFEELNAVRSTLYRVQDFIDRMKNITQAQSEENFSHEIQKTEEKIKEALAEDLNISSALARIFDLIKKGNSLADENHLSQKEAQETISFFQRINQVFACFPLEEKKEIIPQEIIDAAEKRMQARKEKNFKLADELRDYILSQGYLIEDTPQGNRLKKK